MSIKLRRILSIIGLVLILTFTVLLVISLYDSTLLGGSLLYIGVIAGIGGIAIYLMIMRDSRRKNDAEVIAAVEKQEKSEDASKNNQEESNT